MVQFLIIKVWGLQLLLFGFSNHSFKKTFYFAGTDESQWHIKINFCGLSCFVSYWPHTGTCKQARSGGESRDGFADMSVSICLILALTG